MNRVYEFDPLSDARWPDFLLTHHKASVFHSTNWLRTLVSTYRYKPAVLTTSAPGESLRNGLVFCRIKSRITGDRIVSLPFSDHCHPLAESTESLYAIFSHMRDLMDREAMNYIELRPFGEPSVFPETFAKCARYLSHTVDLSGTPESLLGTFHKNCVQRRIRHAERQSITHESGNSEKLLTSFYRLLVITRQRHSLPPQSFRWFRNLATAFGESLCVHLASCNGRPVASILTLKYGLTTTYKYGGSDARFNHLAGMPLLLWKAMQQAMQEGARRFDLGRTDLNNHGLIRFKEHWGAQRAVLDYWRFPGDAVYQPGDSLGRLMRRVVAIAPEWSLILAGKIIYPHIG
jgi:hypothetical protein